MVKTEGKKTEKPITIIKGKAIKGILESRTSEEELLLLMFKELSLLILYDTSGEKDA